jgi:hypothetical protein
MSEHNGNAEEVAAAKGRVIVYPRPDELFLDIDDVASLEMFGVHSKILGDLIEGYRTEPSPSGDPFKYHVTVKLSRPVRDAFERIMLQALLGSDRLHEILSWAAATHGAERPTLFFEKKEN